MIRDPLTGERTLLGATRFERPNEFLDGAEARCAFCPGNEELTPPEIERIGTPQHWEARAFPNKYPAIAPPDGLHEVIVDARDHGDEITPAGVTLWRSRYVAALERMPRAFPVLFKNAGAYAGATLVHPHTQLVVVPERPERWERMQHATDSCMVCGEIRQAAAADTVIKRLGDATAFVRDQSRFSWTLVIGTSECAPSIDVAQESSWREVCQLASEASRALRGALAERASFNLLVYSDPHAGLQRFHWHVELVPRLNTLAGFELSTGMFIRGATAAESAVRWRALLGD